MRRVIQQYGLALAVLACFVFSSVQAADSGPHKHAESQYDAATGSYSGVPGDDWDAIAERFGVSVAELKTLNKLESNLIEVGQKLPLPTGGADNLNW